MIIKKKEIVKRIQTIQTTENNDTKSTSLKESDEIYKKIKQLTKEIDGFESSDDKSSPKEEGQEESSLNKNKSSPKEEGQEESSLNKNKSSPKEEGQEEPSLNKNKSSPEKLTRKGYKIIKYKKKGR